MKRVDVTQHELRVRFVRGLFLKLPPADFREFVTGIAEDEPRARAREAA